MNVTWLSLPTLLWFNFQGRYYLIRSNQIFHQILFLEHKIRSLFPTLRSLRWQLMVTTYGHYVNAPQYSINLWWELWSELETDWIKVKKEIWLLYIIFSLSGLCSSKNWREPIALNLWKPWCSAYDFYEKKLWFSSCPGAKVRHPQGPPGVGIASHCLFSKLIEVLLYHKYKNE